MTNIVKTKRAFLNFVDVAVKLRWLIAFLVFVVLVGFKINFSSMGEYYRYFPTVNSTEQKKGHTIFGESRSIRSDEWAVHTPKYFAQKYNNFGKYSDRNELSPANQIIDYYAPAKDITLIGKPFNWGYILFGLEYGISFYFCMLEILLFMTSFEMCLILTKRKILISFLGMLFVALAPAIQWWLVPHLPIVFAYAMGLFCLFYYFFTKKKLWQKICFGGLLIIAIIGHCISLFPSIQLPITLFFIALLVAVLVRDKDKIVFNRQTAVILFFVFLISLGVILEFILTSFNELKIVSQTEYPSKRFFMGGDGKIDDLFTNLTVLFLPKVDMSLPIDGARYPFFCNTEIASFIHFFPILLLVYMKIKKRLKQEKNRDFYVGQTMFYCLLFFMFFLCVGFNETLAKLTFFKVVRRTYLIYGFVAVVFGVWCFNMLWTKRKILKTGEIYFYAGAHCFFLLTMITRDLRRYIAGRFLVLEIFVFTLIFLFAMLGLKKMCGIITFCVMFIGGGRVNPVCVGISPITNHPISQFVAENIKENPDDLWVVMGQDGYVISGFLMCNGARVVSGTQFYPDLKMWNSLKLDEKNYEIYNRYAHKAFIFTNEEERMFLAGLDNILIYIKPETLKKLNVKHVLIREAIYNK